MSSLFGASGVTFLELDLGTGKAMQSNYYEKVR